MVYKIGGIPPDQSSLKCRCHDAMLINISSYSGILYHPHLLIPRPLPSMFSITVIHVVLSPDPAPKQRGKGLGTGERLLGLAGFGYMRWHCQSSNKSQIWLVRLCCYIPVGSCDLIGLPENKIANDAQPIKHSLVSRPFPLLFGAGSRIIWHDTENVGVAWGRG